MLLSRVLPGGRRKHNFWTARVKSIKNYIIGLHHRKCVTADANLYRMILILFGFLL
jgi:hypothetical protein